MKPYRRLPNYFNVDKIRRELLASDLWGKYGFRGGEGSPHEEMTDIWARFRDPKPFIEKGDFTGFTDPHESVWLEDIPGVKELAYGLMRVLGAGQLGGILITKLPPGGEIKPHVDSGWHAEYYKKYFVPIQNDKGCEFGFDDGVICGSPGQVWEFRNNVTHWVKNESKSDRIAMILCMR